MHRSLRRTALFVALLLVTFEAPARLVDWADILMLELDARDPIPVLSYYDTDGELTLTSAYIVQKMYVERLRKKRAGDRIGGFKAGLTNKFSQAQFGAREPVFGVLLASGEQHDGAVILGKLFRGLVAETEFGYVVAKPIEQRIPNIAILKTYFEAIVPVVELPETGFGKEAKPTAADIIAANVGAARYVVGSRQPITLATDDKVASLWVDGKGVNWAKGSGTYNGQWQALLWLVNNAIIRGWRIEPGQILITGALGMPVPARPGKYVAKFQDAGEIRFEIK